MGEPSGVQTRCTCSSVLGTGDCSYAIYLPWLCKFDWEDESQRRPYCAAIDKCLIHEVIDLWEKGLKTTGCCCGHGRKDMAYIGVRTESIPTMKAMGYQLAFNPNRPGDEDSFVPKTRLTYDISKDSGEWHGSETVETIIAQAKAGVPHD